VESKKKKIEPNCERFYSTLVYVEGSLTTEKQTGEDGRSFTSFFITQRSYLLPFLGWLKSGDPWLTLVGRLGNLQALSRPKEHQEE
jgi:hypothetical protein